MNTFRRSSDHSHHLLRWYTPLLLALWIGAVAGIVQAAAVTFHQHILGDLITLGPSMWWMTPVALILFLLIIGLGLVILGYWKPNWFRRLPVVLPVLLVPALYNDLPLLIPGMNSAAKLVLSIGLAVVILRLVKKNLPRSRRLVTVTIGPVLAIIVGAFLITTVGRQWQEGREIGRLTPAEQGAPNVMILVLDTVRGMSLSLEGNDRPTSPSLEYYAGQGVQFTNAVAASPWTLPSISSMFTGRWPHELTAGWDNRLDDSAPTLAERLRERGYVTAGFVANMSYASRIHGLNRGFIHYEDFGSSLGDVVVSAKLPRDLANASVVRRISGHNDFLGRKTAPELNEAILEWLGALEDGRPWLVFANYFDAHEPCLPPAGMEERLAGPVALQVERPLERMVHMLYHAELPDKASSLSVAGVERELLAYEACIVSLDDAVGRLLDTLRQRGLFRNTVVILTADHGEQFGEHGKFVHGNSLFRQLIDVPLLILAPGRAPAGLIVSEPVSLRDIAITVLDLTGLKEDDFPGTSLGAFWTSDLPQTSPAISELQAPDGLRSFSVVTDSLHYINWHGKRGADELLYAWRTDPEEERDLSNEAAFKGALQKLRATSGGSSISPVAWQAQDQLAARAAELGKQDPPPELEGGIGER